jgi:branched-chain amino acid aminotransferase
MHTPPPAVVYLRDRFLAPDEPPLVSLFDRAYLLGDSIFETLRAYHGVPFRLGQHLDRLAYASAVAGITIPLPRPALEHVITTGLVRAGLPDASIRITVSRGLGTGSVSPAGCDDPLLSVVVQQLRPYPPAGYAAGIRTAIVQTRRIPAASIDPGMKCGNYLPSILARREVDARGMLEAIQLGTEDQVVSGTVSNLFLIHGDRLITPDLASGCLPGVTRACVLALANDVGLKATEQRLGVEDVYAADEAFFANTLMECLPICEVDGRRYAAAPGPGTTKVHAALTALIHEECHRRIDH